MKINMCLFMCVHACACARRIHIFLYFVNIHSGSSKCLQSPSDDGNTKLGSQPAVCYYLVPESSTASQD